jgi:hypothetical protein
MPTVAPDCGTSGPSLSGGELWLPGCPWSFRLAGPHSACPALELYEAGHLIDIVSSTRVAVSLLRGARSAAGELGQRTIAWGRMPVTGNRPLTENWPQVRFAERGWRRDSQAAAAVQVTTWCWVAVASGSFAAATVRTSTELLRRRIVRGRPWC